MSWLYDFGFWMFGLISLPHFLARLNQAEDRGRLVRERFGYFSPEAVAFGKTNPVWIHGVSVGEVLAAEKLIRTFQERYPQKSLVLTTVTPTGQKIAKRWESGKVKVTYFPFDGRGPVRRFFRTFQPSLLLLVETEIWPNVLKEAHSRRVPAGIVNGRISERSFNAFRRFSRIFHPVFKCIRFFLVQTEKDRQRLILLGLDPEHIQITGNMKLDAFDLKGADLPKDSLRRDWGFSSSDLVLIGGSTHPGEEASLLDVLRVLRGEGLPVKLLLAPRHVDRADKILKDARRRGFRAVLSSRKKEDFDVMVLDQLGILRNLYPMADAVFMGGSLIRHGGQNPVEPAAARRAILHGPWVFNFQDLYQCLLEEGGTIRVKNDQELGYALKRILRSERERTYLGNQAYRILQKLQGATERNLNWIANVGLIRLEEKGMSNEHAFRSEK